MKFTNNDVDDILLNLGGKIKRLEDYKNNQYSHLWCCQTCNHKWRTNFGNIYHKKIKCPKCINKLPICNEIVDKRLSGRNVVRLENVSRSCKKIKWKCTICMHIWLATTNDVTPPENSNRNATNCPKCTNHLQLSNEIIDERLFDRPTKRISNYTGYCCDDIEWECLICNKRWFSKTQNVVGLSNKCQCDCPDCHKYTSKGENNTFKILKNSLKLNIKRHHIISNLQIKKENGEIIQKRIEVDFYLEKEDKVIFIEHNGYQHYMPVRFYSSNKSVAKEKFKNQQIRDNYLRNYCKENGIYLIEINILVYKNKKTIEAYLRKELGKIISLP